MVQPDKRGDSLCKNDPNQSYDLIDMSRKEIFLLIPCPVSSVYDIFFSSHIYFKNSSVIS